MKNQTVYLLKQIKKNRELGNTLTCQMYYDSLVNRIGLVKAQQLIKEL